MRVQLVFTVSVLYFENVKTCFSTTDIIVSDQFYQINEQPVAAERGRRAAEGPFALDWGWGLSRRRYIRHL